MPIKVLIIAPRFGSVSRGVEVFVEELARRMDKNRFELCILSARHEQVSVGVEMAQYPLLPRERFKPWLAKLLSLLPARMHLGAVELESLSLMFTSRRFLRDGHFDVVLPFGGTWSYRFAKWLCNGASVLSVGHGGPVQADLMLSDFFVALTPTDQYSAHELLPGIPCQVIPNGVDSTKFCSGAHKNYSQKKTILCVAALTADKCHELLFNAVLKLDPNVKLVCAGNGPLLQKLQQHPLYQMNRVSFISESHDRMPDLYRSADVFTLASPQEAFGLVFLEALACGIPVVAHDAPRQKYVIGDTGIFCNTLNSSAYADGLARALNLPFDQRRIEHAKQFDWRLVVDDYQSLMVRLVESQKQVN